MSAVESDIRSQTRESLAAQFEAWKQPAYRLDQLLGWLYARRAASWDEMTNLIDDGILEQVAVVGERSAIAGKLTARLEGIADSVSLTHNRCPDPHHWADVVRDLKAGNTRRDA